MTTTYPTQPTTVDVPALSPESWRALLDELMGQQPADVARITRGAEVLTSQRLRETGDGTKFVIPSCTRKGVAYVASGWSCTCPDAFNRSVVCKHMWAVIILVTATVKARRERLERQQEVGA